jgi:hypothetical protein
MGIHRLVPNVTAEPERDSIPQGATPACWVVQDKAAQNWCIFCTVCVWNRLASQMAMCIFCTFVQRFAQRLCKAYAILKSEERKVSMGEIRLNAWIPEELKAYLADRAKHENRGMNQVLADIIRQEQAREQGAVIEQHSLPVIREIVQTELRKTAAQLRSDLRDDVGLDMKTVQTKSDNRLAALIIRATRDAAIARRLIYTVLAKAHGPEFAHKAYETATERVGKELAARPAQSEQEP